MASYGSGFAGHGGQFHGQGVPFPAQGGQYSTQGSQYPAQGGQYSAQGAYANPGSGYGPPGGGFGVAPQPMASAPPAADPYANAQPGTIAYAKSEGPDGIATYTPVIAQETFYQTPSGPTRGIKWVTATSSQASAAGIPAGAITASTPAQLPQPNGMSMPPITMPHMSMPPMSAVSGPGSTAGGYPPESPADDYPTMRPGMTPREYEKAVKRWEKDRRAAEKRARREEKERPKKPAARQPQSQSEWADSQDPYGIVAPQDGGRPRRMSTGAALGGFERARRISGAGALRDDELSRKLEALDTSFNTRRERRMSGNYAASTTGGYRSRKGSVTEADRARKVSGSYDLQRQSYYPTAGGPMPGAPGGGYPPIPGGYGAGARSVPGSPTRPHSAFAPGHYDDVGVPPMRGGPSPHPGPYGNRSRHPSPSMGPSQLPGGYGGDRGINPATGYPYNVERTPYSTASASLAGGPADAYALTRRPGTAAGGAGGYPNVQVPGRELNRAQPFTAFEEFFLVEDLRELLQPQPPPLPAALVPHDVMAEEWDRCMQNIIQLAVRAFESTRSSALDPLLDAITQWNTQFFLPRGVDVSVYKGNSRRSGPSNFAGLNLRAHDEDESESESSSSSSSSSESSSDDRYFSSRREAQRVKKAERKARRKERARRRRARRRERSVSIRVRAIPVF